MKNHTTLKIVFFAALIFIVILFLIPPREIFHEIKGIEESLRGRNCGALFSIMHTDVVADAEPLFYVEGKCLKEQEITNYSRLALIAIEDKRFYDHSGLDIISIGRAVGKDLKCLCLKEGASTLTQQLARNIYLNPEKKISRKTKEIIIALKIESAYTKEEILNFYLNYVYYGDELYGNKKFNKPMYGIEQASQFYLAKSATNLTLAESALIVGTLRNPKSYSPYLNYSNAKKRQEKILDAMLLQGFINNTEYLSAVNQNILLIKREQDYKSIFEKYYGEGSYSIISSFFYNNSL